MTVRGYCKGEDGKDFYLLKTKVTLDEFDGPLWMFVEQRLVTEVNDLAFPSDMSDYTKGTRSQYATMRLGYPLQNTYFNYISAPFGPYKPNGTWKAHRAFDLAKVGNTSILGQKVIAVTSGKVVNVYDDDNDTDHGNGIGNGIAIESDHLIDPATGENLRFVYMHMQYKPFKIDKNGKDTVFLTDGSEIKVTYFKGGGTEKVEEGEVIGLVGQSGGQNSPHLHLEVLTNGKTYIDNLDRTQAADHLGWYEHRVNPAYFYPTGTFTVNTTGTMSEKIGSNDPDELLYWEPVGGEKYKK